MHFFAASNYFLVYNKKMKFFLVILIFTSQFLGQAFALDSLKQAALVNCSVKPIPQLGSSIGECIQGVWQQICP